jgi:ABC-type transporter Mla subunit MlaD
VENRLLLGLQRSVLRPEVIEYAIGEFERQLKGALANLSTSLEQMRQRREAIQQEIDRLVAAFATVGHSPALVNALSDRERELAEITGKIFAAQPDSVSAHISRVREFVTDRLGNIRQLLYSDVQKAKGELAKHVRSIEMVPQAEGKEGHYVAIGEWNLLGGLEDENAERVRMVAGVGFEPAIFGL